MILGGLATLATALFAGAAVYISLVEHPARMACPPGMALAQWRPSYRRATVMQASLALLGFLLALAAWVAGAGGVWLVAGLLQGAVIPFTLLVMWPTNKALEAPALDPAGPEAHGLLGRWGRLHAARSALSLLALVLEVLAG